MKLTRTLAGAALLLSVFAVSPARAATARVPMLMGEVLISGSRTTSMAVRLPRPVTVSYRDVKLVRGIGRITMVVLKADGGQFAPQLQDVHFGLCGAPGCAEPWPTQGWSSIFTPATGYSADTATLPAGRYRLYLVTDGGPVTYHLHLPGLKGSMSLRPTEEAHASVVNAVPDPTVPQNSPLVFSGGSEHRTGPYGTNNELVVWKHHLVPDPAATTRGVCLRAPESDSLAGAPYQAPCGGVGLVGNSIIAPTLLDKTDYYTEISTGWLIVPNQDVGIGGYIDSADPSDAAFSQQLWLDYSN